MLLRELFMGNNSFRSFTQSAVLLLSLLFSLSQSRAVIFYDTADPTHNAAAPTGTYLNSGWQYEGYFGSFLGTMIAPTLFVTAQHFGVNSSTFSYDTVFSGTTTATYSINTAANSGIGYWDIANTDLRVYQITGGTFSTYASIYTGSAEVGSDIVITGRGTQRGAAVNLAPDGLKGWKYGTSDGVARWGRNTVDAAVNAGSLGNLLVASFNATSGRDEATLSNGDSGGGAFIKVGSNWQLVGINYGIEGSFDTNNTKADGTEFAAALTDKGGFWEGSDAAGWTFMPNTAQDQASQLYISQISASASAIQNVISIAAVPEPGTALLVLGGFLVLGAKRRP
jgi:hypothetical protein